MGVAPMGKAMRACVVAAVVVALAAAAVRSVWPGGSGGWTAEPPEWRDVSAVVLGPPPEIEVFRIRREPPGDRDGRIRGPLDRPGQTDEEKLCRLVILWAKSLLREKLPASQLERLLADLDAALADRLRRDGRIDPPDRP